MGRKKKKTGDVFASPGAGRKLTVKRFLKKFDAEEILSAYDIRNAVRVCLNLSREELLETLVPENARDPNDEEQVQKVSVLLQLTLGFIQKANNSVKDYLEVVKFAYPELAKEETNDKPQIPIIINWTPQQQ